MAVRFIPKSKDPPNGKAVGGLNGYQKMLHYVTTSVFLQNLVSKSRRRMLVAGYDLDMSYITEHLLAMSYPAQRMRAMYRNPLWQVKDVLDMRHPGRYKGLGIDRSMILLNILPAYRTL